MVRFASLWAALLSAGILLASGAAMAYDTSSASDTSSIATRRQGRSHSVLERVDRLVNDGCACEGQSTRCTCVRPERRVFEKLSGSHESPQLPKNARYDASAGVFL